MKWNHRVGRMVKVRAGALAGLRRFSGDRDDAVDCMVVCATPTGAYCVAVEGSGIVAVVGTDDIISEPESFSLCDPGGIRVVFFGNGGFALPVLERLSEDGYDIAAVVTNPDSRQGRGRRSRPTPVAEYARSKGLNVLTPLSAADPGLVGEISRLRPSVGIVVEYGILPKAVYRMPRHGTVNLHSSLLPEYRGASTVSSAIRDGKPYTGLTTFALSGTVDGGNIINNMFIPIEDGDNSEDVLARMRVHGPGMVADAIQLVVHGAPLLPQEELSPYLSRTEYASKVFRDDLCIDWGMTAGQVCDFIRAYAPSPSAWTDLRTDDGREFAGVKMHVARVTGLPAGDVPGRWRAEGGRLLVSASDLMVSVESLQPRGRRILTAADFCNGFHGHASGHAGPGCKKDNISMNTHNI